MSQDQDYRKKVYGVLKNTYGDKFTQTEESFIESLDSTEGYE